MEKFKLILAPMDGVLDVMMREVLTSCNHYYYAESEFVRIVDRPVTAEQLYKKVPELKDHDGLTASGTPVYVQFLGQNRETIARSALLAVKMGARGIDLNFGCPAKKVNNSHGGAALLKEPELIHDICSNVREMLPAEIPVTAKMRLGYENTDNYLLLAEKIYSAGVNALCVHGRTKMDGYLPGTVKWELIGDIRRQCPVTVIANGDIFSKESAQQCAQTTGCDHLMLARGALYVPNLAAVINENAPPFGYGELAGVIEKFLDAGSRMKFPVNLFARLKQFLSYLRVHYTELEQPFRNVCRCDNLDSAVAALMADLKRIENEDK